MREMARSQYMKQLGLAECVIQREIGKEPTDKMLAEVFEAIVGGVLV